MLRAGKRADPAIAAGATRAEDVEAGADAAGPRRPGRPPASIARRNSPAASGSGRPWPGPLIRRPDLLLADEPTGNLDQHHGRAGRRSLLVELQQTEPMILIVVTHSQRLAAMMGRQLELAKGRDCGSVGRRL